MHRHPMDEGCKRVIGIIASILVARHPKTTEICSIPETAIKQTAWLVLRFCFTVLLSRPLCGCPAFTHRLWDSLPCGGRHAPSLLRSTCCWGCFGFGTRRTAAAFPRGMTLIIGIASEKGGVGKSTLAGNPKTFPRSRSFSSSTNVAMNLPSGSSLKSWIFLFDFLASTLPIAGSERVGAQLV